MGNKKIGISNVEQCIGEFCCRIVRVLSTDFSSISKRANLILRKSGGPLQTRTMMNDETRFSEWDIRRLGSPMLNNNYIVYFCCRIVGMLQVLFFYLKTS
jgi:hypothetical protein